jgi:hypothetical protein
LNTAQETGLISLAYVKKKEQPRDALWRNVAPGGNPPPCESSCSCPKFAIGSDQSKSHKSP